MYAKTPENSALTGTNSALVEFFIEFKISPKFDPFGPDEGPLVKDTTDAKNTLGQISTYISFQMGAQYRTHIFFVLIIGDYARLLRWDRSGVVVSERIKYNKQRQLFAFLELFNAATPEIQGRDKSVSKPSKDEKEDAWRTCHEFDTDNTLLVIEFPKEGQRASNRYIISSPRSRICLPIGRMTRTSIAYDVQKKKRVFMKDSWRVKAHGCRPEGEVYEILNRGHARNIPKCVEFCDVGDEAYHQTRSQTFAASLHGKQFNTHRHHRLILDTVGEDLDNFKRSFDLVKAIRAALIGTKFSLTFWVFVYLLFSSSPGCSRSWCPSLRHQHGKYPHNT